MEAKVGDYIKVKDFNQEFEILDKDYVEVETASCWIYYLRYTNIDRYKYVQQDFIDNCIVIKSKSNPLYRTLNNV